MSYQEKKALVSVFTGIAVLAAYCVFAYGKFKAGEAAPDDMKFWAGAMLLFIGVGIVAMIAIFIVFHILLSVSIAVRDRIDNGSSDDKRIEKELAVDMVEDEMNKLVELKSMRVGFGVAGFGIVAALASAYLGCSPAFMMNVIFVSLSLGSILEGLCQLYFYRRGVTHG